MSRVPERGATSEGQFAAPEDRPGSAESAAVVRRHDRLLRLRYVNNHFKLQGLGDVSEMGDAVLGLVASEMAERAPCWLAIRHVSDPQIKADGLTLKQQAAIAAQIYKGFGRWSSVCSAITCWASIAAE
jgi:hypothetical protein